MRASVVGVPSWPAKDTSMINISRGNFISMPDEKLFNKVVCY